MNEKENMFCVVHTIATVWALAKKKERLGTIEDAAFV